jgi:hypothetical protein
MILGVPADQHKPLPFKQSSSSRNGGTPTPRLQTAMAPCPAVRYLIAAGAPATTAENRSNAG